MSVRKQEDFLDLIHVLLQMRRGGPNNLAKMLEAGGSVWTVRGNGLVRRVDPGVQQAFDQATRNRDNASAAVAGKAQSDTRAVEGSRGCGLNRRAVVPAQVDVCAVEDRADLLDRVVGADRSDELGAVAVDCHVEAGVVLPARPIKIARVLALLSVFVLDESSKLMNRPPALLFTTPLPSEPTSTADSA